MYNIFNTNKLLYSIVITYYTVSFINMLYISKNIK